MYEAKNFDHLFGLEGLSEQLLKNHFVLYQGYVANANKLAEKLVVMIQEERAATPEYAELKRRFGWEFNGMRLHEFYFGNLAKGHLPQLGQGKLLEKIIQEFGSLDVWLKDFKATALARGIGWVILYYDKEADRLFNVWINEHDTGHLSGAAPLLVLDVFEHAYMLDYGLKKGDYIEVFLKAVDWPAVEERMK
ncbi:MAG: Fe-Mn family superoxide dismutase [bacterium]|nr:Fe-Mn family superoxide dismutase [bacterium]